MLHDDSATIERIVIIKTILDSGCSILDKKNKNISIQHQESSILYLVIPEGA